MSSSASDTADLHSATPTQPDLTLCDVEPIHVPGSIQPHGVLLIADARTLVVTAGAGDIETRLDPDWLGKGLDDLLGQDIRSLLDPVEHTIGSAMTLVQVRGHAEIFDVSLHRSSDLVLVQLEPAPLQPTASGEVLTLLDNAGTKFARAGDITTLCQEAAQLFRELTGFDRVMIYRFLDDDAGCVMAEAQAPELHSFLHHHFPASDIPRQARALYVRNRVRVIPDVAYVPAVSRLHAYGIANLYYDLIGGSKTNLAGVILTGNTDPLWGGIGAGGSYSWEDEAYALHGEVALNTALDHFGGSYDVTGSAGVRVRY